MEGAHRGCELGVPPGALDETGVHAGFEPMGGVRMSEGRAGHTCFGEAGAVFGCAEGALDAGPTPGGGRGRTVVVIPPGGGKEPGCVPRGLPGGAQQSQRICGPGDGPGCGPLAAGEVALEALAINGRDLRGEGVMEPEAHARDGGAGDVVVEGGGGGAESPHLRHTAHGGETVGGLRAQEREGVPVALEDVVREEAEATGADAQGRWGKAIAVVAVQAGVLKLLCSEAVGGCVGALSQQADVPDRGFLRPFALATEVASRKHVLTQ